MLFLGEEVLLKFSDSSHCLPGQQDSCNTTVELSENSLQNLLYKEQPSLVRYVANLLRDRTSKVGIMDARDDDDD